MSVKALSRETQNALALITDPYHDTEITAVGFPDDAAAYSIINRYNLRRIIACPFVLTAGDSWAFHVYATPLITNSIMALRLITGSDMMLRDTSSTLGPLCITYHHFRAGTLIAHQTESLSVPSPTTNESFAGRSRIVSHGYEIHNTTAALSKCGSLTTYRTSNPPIDVSLYDSVTTSDYGVANQTVVFSKIASLPHSIAQAEMLPGTVTWDAAQGVYAVSLPEAHNTFSSEFHQNALIQYAPNPNFRTTSFCATRADKCATSPLRCAGTFSSQFPDSLQTFNLDFRLVLETVPNPNDTLSLSYCRRTSEHNPQFLKLYKAMLNHIPPGVPVNQNSAGDWFRKIAGIVREVLPLVPNVLPPTMRPIAMAALPIADTLLGKLAPKPERNDLSNRYLSKQQTKRPLRSPAPKQKLSPAQRKILAASFSKRLASKPVKVKTRRR